MHSFKAAKLIAMIMFVINVFVIFIVGCDDLPDNIQQQVQNQPYSWYATDDGLCKYRWENDGSCVVMTAGQQYRLLRTNQSGINGPISWKWEQDGDLDIAIGTKQYDLDSPLDSINDDDASSDYYEEEDEFDYSDAALFGTIGAGGAYLMSKKEIKVYGYDNFGNPLDRKGRVISKFDKQGKLIKFRDVNGNPIKNDGKQMVHNTTITPGQKISTTGKVVLNSNYNNKIQVKSPLKSLTMKSCNMPKPTSSHKTSTKSKR